MMHADVLRQLLPTGAYDPNASNLGVELNAVGKQMDLAQISADGLLAEMHAHTAMLGFFDWERNYGLPDPCVTVLQNIEQRRAALESKVLSQGGQSAAYYVSIAQSMGYAGASVTEFSRMTCNSDCNSALNSDADLFVWQLNLPSASGVFFMSCNSDCNSALQSWGDGAVQCRIGQIKPAHTTVIFAYP